MIELVLIVCLSQTPDQYQTIYLRNGGPGNMMQCLYSGAKQAADWLQAHPGYVVQRWTCGYMRT